MSEEHVGASYCERFDSALERAERRSPAITVDGRTIDHGKLIDRLRRLWSLFDAKGLWPGDRIGVASADAFWVSALVLAGTRYGLGVATLNSEFSPAELGRALSGCGLSWAFLDPAHADKTVLPPGCGLTRIAASAGPAGPGLLGRMMKSRSRDADPGGLDAEIERLAPRRDLPPRVPGNATALMLFTSGTTRAPKVVELSHDNVSAQLAAIDSVFGYDRSTRILNPLPLHFTDGLFHGPLSAFCAGASLYRQGRFDIARLDELMHSIYRERITHFIVVPAVLAMMDRLGEAFSDAFHTSDFKLIRSSGDTLPEPLWRAIEARFGVMVVNTYGMSESSCEVFFCGPDPASRKVGTIGRPVLCEARLEKVDAASGEGELLLRGPLVMKGYFGQPELTAETLGDGWLRTGDIARIDADGFATIVGRSKNLIITGGINVHPQEVTDHLLTHPAINDAVTFGVPHAMWGEQVACAIVLHEGATMDAQAVLDFCRVGLAPQKCPRLVHFVDSLPRNAAGKVLVDVLARQVASTDMSIGSDADRQLGDRILDIAAQIFNTPRASLRLTSEPATTAGWDSLAHLNLVAEVERRFAVRFSARDILAVGSLDDVVRLVRAALERAGA